MTFVAMGELIIFPRNSTRWHRESCNWLVAVSGNCGKQVDTGMYTWRLDCGSRCHVTRVLCKLQLAWKVPFKTYLSPLNQHFWPSGEFSPGMMAFSL